MTIYGDVSCIAPREIWRAPRKCDNIHSFHKSAFLTMVKVYEQMMRVSKCESLDVVQRASVFCSRQVLCQSCMTFAAPQHLA